MQAPGNTRYLLLIVLPFALFILAPVLFLFKESLLDDTGRLTLENLKILGATSRQIGLMKTSLVLAGFTSLTSLLIGVPLAFLLHKTDLPGKKYLAFVCLIPLLLPPYIQALVWTGLSLPCIHTPAGAVFVFTLSFFPFVTIITGSGLRSVDLSMEEAALMSRGKWQTIQKITLPMITPHIMAGGIIVFVFTIINFEVPDALRVMVYPVEIFIHFSAYYDEKTATLLSTPLIGLTLFLIWGQMIYMKNKSYVALGQSHDEHGLFLLNRFRFPCLIWVFTIVTVSVIIPLVFLVKGAGYRDNYMQVFSNSRDHIFYSIVIALSSALIMTLISFPVAYYLVRSKGILSTTLDYVIQLSFGIPSIVLGIGLIRVWNRDWSDGIYSSSWILIFAFISGYSPFVIKVICAKIHQIHTEWEEAALLGTGSRLKTLVGIVLPLSMPGIVTGFFIGFVLSLFNLGTALLVIPPGKGSLPISIYNFMHYGAMDAVYAQSVILITIAVICGALLYPVYRWTNKRKVYHD